MPETGSEQASPTAGEAVEVTAEAPRPPPSPAAARALAEAEERRKARRAELDLPPEINGRKGPEPVRYGDWEVKGIASDF